MALFKPSCGLSINLPSEIKDGYMYFCTDTGEIFMDYINENGVLQRKQINANEARSLLGYSITTEVLNESNIEIPTSGLVKNYVDESLDTVAYISESNEDVIVETELTSSELAGTIHRFSVEINCAPMYIEEDNFGPEFNDGTDMYTDYGVLIFPESYTDKGKKTRLVISAHGGGGTVSADSSQAEYQSISQYLVANGYAVMDVNGLPEQYAINHGNLRLQDSVGSYLAI